MRFQLHWHDEALADLEQLARRAPRQAERVVDQVERWPTIGPTGHPWSQNRRFWYRAVPPLGVIYGLVGREIHLLRVIDVRQEPEAP